MEGVGVRLFKRDIGFPQRFLRRTGHGQGQIKEADNGRSLRAAEMDIAAANCVSGDAALPIGWAGQGDQRRPTAGELADLDGVAHRKDVRVARCASDR